MLPPQPLVKVHFRKNCGDNNRALKHVRSVRTPLLRAFQIKAASFVAGTCLTDFSLEIGR